MLSQRPPLWEQFFRWALVTSLVASQDELLLDEPNNCYIHSISNPSCPHVKPQYTFTSSEEIVLSVQDTLGHCMSEFIACVQMHGMIYSQSC